MGEEKEKNIKVQKGLIGFFDILGYTSLLENNEPEYIYKEIYPILKNLEEYFKSKLKIIKVIKGKKTNVRQQFQNPIDDMEWYVFSDTILITFNISKYTYKDRGYLWSIFIAGCCILQKNMFQEGLPLRGVINFGKYIVQKDFFAGKPIIEAYKISTELDLSACIMTSEATNVYNKDIEKTEKSTNLRCSLNPFLNYDVPIKGNKKIEMNTLCARVEDCEEDKIRIAVIDSFGSHYKDIKNSVIKKIDNTEKWIKYRRKYFDPKADALKS